jgi:hypothetical protein
MRYPFVTSKHRADASDSLETCIFCPRADSQVLPVQGLSVTSVSFCSVVRHLLTVLRYDQDTLAITGHSGSKLHLFSATTGHIQWSTVQHRPGQHAGGADGVFWRSDVDSDIFDIVSLSDGKTVRRIDGKSGEVKWTWAADGLLLPSVLFLSCGGFLSDLVLGAALKPNYLRLSLIRLLTPTCRSLQLRFTLQPTLPIPTIASPSSGCPLPLESSLFHCRRSNLQSSPLFMTSDYSLRNLLG